VRYRAALRPDLPKRLASVRLFGFWTQGKNAATIIKRNLSKGMSAGELLACLFRTAWRPLNLPMNAEKSLRKAAKILAYAGVARKSSRP
jgi:hypothetical protein